MKTIRSFVLLTILTFACSASSSAQVCGDANDDVLFNLVDIAATLDYIAGLPGTVNLSNVDCDGVTGITIGDVSAMAGDIFRGESALDCSPSGSYSYSLAGDDTLHIIRINDIPSSVDEVFMHVYGTFSEATTGVYMPFLENGTGSSNLFNVSNSYGLSNSISGSHFVSPNNRVLFSVPSFPGEIFNGESNLLLLKYARNSPGTASIFPEAFDNTSPLFISIARNNDLYTPVVVYHDAVYPNGVLHASEDELVFNALSDAPAIDTFSVEITTGALSVGYNLTTPTSWIQIDKPTGVTPETVTFTADAAGLGALDYFGVVRVYYDGFYPLVDSINLTLSVYPPGNQSFPAGDVNCDGALNNLDLLYLVNYFFRSGTPPFPCE